MFIQEKGIGLKSNIPLMTSFRGFNLISTKCCGAIYSAPRYASFNASAFEYWTDGTRVHSLIPTDGGLRQCRCGSYFLMKSTFIVGFEIERSIPSAEFIKDVDLEFLLNEELSTEVEIVVRRRYWRFLNEPYRDLYRAHREKEELINLKQNTILSQLLLRFGFIKLDKPKELKFFAPK